MMAGATCARGPEHSQELLVFVFLLFLLLLYCFKGLGFLGFWGLGLRFLRVFQSVFMFFFSLPMPPPASIPNP